MAADDFAKAEADAAACPVCCSRDTFVGVDRRSVPILMNRLYATAAEARAVPRGDLRIRFCRDCGFAWNTAFDPALIVYDAHYENDQTHSPAFLAHVRERADAVIAAAPGAEPLRFLEIGCGQGGFIGEVARRAGSRLRAAEGFDAAWRGADEHGPNGSIIHRDYFNAATAHRLRSTPNVVASRHTIEHIPDPVAFLVAIRTALGPASRARFFIETPTVEWIVRNDAMQDFFYEHCSLFTSTSLTYALRRAGFDHVVVEDVFGGQYLWASAEAGEPAAVSPPQGEGIPHIGDVFEGFAERWRSIASESAQAGPVAVWGAGAKGVTFAMMIDPERQHIDHVIDVNPAKQGLFLAGSGLAVLPPQQSARRGTRTIIVMNPNYLAEISMQASDAGLAARILPLQKRQTS